MNRQTILATILSLASSQGFYGQLYNALTSDSEEAEEYLNELEAQNFSSPMDMILYIEC